MLYLKKIKPKIMKNLMLALIFLPMICFPKTSKKSEKIFNDYGGQLVTAITTHEHSELIDVNIMWNSIKSEDDTINIYIGGIHGFIELIDGILDFCENSKMHESTNFGDIHLNFEYAFGVINNKISTKDGHFYVKTLKLEKIKRKVNQYLEQKDFI